MPNEQQQINTIDREKTTRFPWFPRIAAMKFLDEPACRNVSEGFP
jgi:hypothetical protein